jgi:hypothetical protein
MRENRWVRVIRNIYKKGMERRRKEKTKIIPLSRNRRRRRKKDEKEEMKNQVRNQNYGNYKERSFWYSKKKGKTKYEEVYLPTAVHGTEM